MLLLPCGCLLLPEIEGAMVLSWEIVLLPIFVQGGIGEEIVLPWVEGSTGGGGGSVRTAHLAPFRDDARIWSPCLWCLENSALEISM
ncbi:hypothetical protein B0O80DRAFT_464949 [Mortierella sp. GBAus27b]|nr:hypothetical protein B0O80DRAFT_464949 [Mortierella sp. GBAus27b]